MLIVLFIQNNLFLLQYNDSKVIQMHDPAHFVVFSLVPMMKLFGCLRKMSSKKHPFNFNFNFLGIKRSRTKPNQVNIG